MIRRQRSLGNGKRTLSVRSDYVQTSTGDSPVADFVVRWWPLLLVGGLLGLGGAYAYGKLGPASYQSSALVQVRADPSSNRPATDSQIAAIGIAAAAVAPPVLDRMSQALKSDGINLGPTDLVDMSLSNKLTVAPIKGSSAITVAATYENPATAQAIADKAAAVIVDDAANQARNDANARQTELQTNLDQARADLSGAQLFQREQDLQQRLQTQQTLLLQLQSSYQQSLQQQVQVALLMQQAQTPQGPQTPVPTADQQRQLNSLSTTAAQALATELANLKTQQDTAQQSIDEIDAQLGSVTKQLSLLPDPTATANPASGGTPGALDITGKIASLQQQQDQLRDQLGQQQVLEKSVSDLTKQRDDLRAQIRTLQSQIQQATGSQQTQVQQRQQQQQQIQQQIQREQGQQGMIKAQIDTIVPLKNQPDLTNEQQARLQALNMDVSNSKIRIQQLNDQLQVLSQSGTSTAATDDTVKLFQKQLVDIQAAEVGVEKQLKDAQDSSAALQQAIGPNSASTLQTLGNQILQQQQAQRNLDATDKQNQTQRATLVQQQQDLQRQKDAARAQLLQIQRQQQQDIQQQAQLGQHDIQAQVVQNGSASNTAANAGIPAGLMDQSTGLRDDLVTQMSQQEQQVRGAIAGLQAQLDDVHAAQAALPVKLDGAQAAAQVIASSQRISVLSQELTRLLVSGASGDGPLQRLGPAAPAIPAGGGLRLLPLGAAAGVAVGCVLAYLLHLLSRARRTRTPRPWSGASSRALPAGRPAPLARQGAQLASSRVHSSRIRSPARGV